jgi:hypothetical protein
MLDVAGMLDRLSELYAQQEALEAEKQALILKVIPPEVKVRLDDIEAEFVGKAKAASANIEELEASIKTATLSHGESVRGAGFQAVWNKGRLTWDSKGLNAYADEHPEVLQYRKEGEPSITIRKVTGKSPD